MQRLQVWKARLLSEAGSERGQALVEYALVLALVSVVSIGALAALGSSISNIYDHINDQLLQVLGLHGHCGHKDCQP